MPTERERIAEVLRRSTLEAYYHDHWLEAAEDVIAAVVPPVMRSLMYAENLGDVHDVLNRLAAAVGFELQGDFLDGWTDDDLRHVGVKPDDSERTS